MSSKRLTKPLPTATFGTVYRGDRRNFTKPGSGALAGQPITTGNTLEDAG
ncbi:hypothetical protein N9207_00075 [bacterium]|nr:hypothetical protein [bacterium]